MGAKTKTEKTDKKRDSKQEEKKNSKEQTKSVAKENTPDITKMEPKGMKDLIIYHDILLVRSVLLHYYK